MSCKNPSCKKSKCKDCRRIYKREKYQSNPQIYREAKKKARDKLRYRIYQYLQLSACIDCGESNPVVLEFDHIGEKNFDVSRAVNSCFSWTKIYLEIQKCEVRCANCHRIKTARDFGWYSFLKREPEEQEKR